MSSTGQLDSSPDEGDGDRLRGIISPDALPIDLVSAFAGDRPLSEAEGAHLRELESKRGKVFFSDLLYAICHHYFAPELAEGVWHEVLAHKYTMSATLGRNVRITVATLDYLSNITGELSASTLMSEASVSEIVILSMRDGLTGIFNHSAFYELLELELKHQRRYGVGVALILLDLDDFKSVNDRWGHQEGDRILSALARTLEAETRDADICCRFGGDEFAVILPFTDDPSAALEIAERIRAAAVKIVSHGQPIAISAGVALGEGATQTARALVEQADRSLYRAKRSGKNKVVVSDSSSGRSGAGTPR